MIGLTYIHVPDGHRALRVTAFRQSPRPQTIRIGGAHQPNKTSTICEFAKAELRPAHRQSADAYILAQQPPNYWLAVQIFSRSQAGWHQSSTRTKSQLQVPVMVLALDSATEDGIDVPGVALRIIYFDGPIPQPPSGICR